jgi:hypothetical protein
MLAAAIACLPKGAGLAQSCRVCRTSPRLRAEWGCDGPAAEPWGYLECLFCQGEDPACASCSGTGQIPQHDCPHRVVSDREFGVVTVASMTESGVLPDSGGWNDQAASFVAVFPFAVRVMQEYRKIAAEYEARNQGHRR